MAHVVVGLFYYSLQSAVNMKGEIYYFENIYREIGKISLIVVNRNVFGEASTEYQVRKLQVNGSSICTAFTVDEFHKALSWFNHLVNTQVR